MRCQRLRQNTEKQDIDSIMTDKEMLDKIVVGDETHEFFEEIAERVSTPLIGVLRGYAV